MGLIRNVGAVDRFFRAVVGVSLLIGAFFWFHSVLKVMAYVLGIIFLLTSILGVCIVYRVLNLTTYVKAKDSTAPKKLMTFIVILLFLFGTITSHYLTKRDFLHNFNKVNQDYKQLLLSSISENREGAVANYVELTQDYESFYEKYLTYRPWVIRGDKEFTKNLQEIKSIIEDSSPKINYGNLTAGYAGLEAIRPLINDIRRRNNLQSDMVAFSDFYGAMAILVEAAISKDASQVKKEYLLANEKLKDIETFNNNSEVKLLRSHLEEINNLAEKGDIEKLPFEARELKNSYLRIYAQGG